MNSEMKQAIELLKIQRDKVIVEANNLYDTEVEKLKDHFAQPKQHHPPIILNAADKVVTVTINNAAKAAETAAEYLKRKAKGIRG